jgi:hypothetical protein
VVTILAVCLFLEESYEVLRLSGSAQFSLYIAGVICSHNPLSRDGCSREQFNCSKRKKKPKPHCFHWHCQTSETAGRAHNESHCVFQSTNEIWLKEDGSLGGRKKDESALRFWCNTNILQKQYQTKTRGILR